MSETRKKYSKNSNQLDFLREHNKTRKNQRETKRLYLDSPKDLPGLFPPPISKKEKKRSYIPTPPIMIKSAGDEDVNKRGLTRSKSSVGDLSEMDSSSSRAVPLRKMSFIYVPDSKENEKEEEADIENQLPSFRRLTKKDRKLTSPYLGAGGKKSKRVKRVKRVKKTHNKYRSVCGGSGDISDLKKKLEDAKQGDKSKLNMTIEDINRLLLVASKNGNREAVIRLFLNHKVNPNYQNEYGNTPLIVASDHGHDSIVKILLNKGADPNIENTHGWTPIDFAVGYLSEQGKSKKEILESKLFTLLAEAGGHPGRAFFNLFIEDNNLKDSDKNTRAMRHRVTEPGDDSKSK